MYARGMSDSKLRALGESHSRGRLDIRPELYDLWLGALLLTVSGHDKQFNESIRSAWREVLNKGISVIKAGY